MFAAINNVFNLKWEKSSKNRYKHVQIVKTCTNIVQIVKKNYIHSVAVLQIQLEYTHVGFSGSRIKLKQENPEIIINPSSQS